MSEGLRAQELSVTFRLPGQDIRAVDGVTAHSGGPGPAAALCQGGGRVVL